MNTQNNHIMQKLEETKAAASALIAEGLTVTHIEIEGAHPRLHLLRGPRKTGALPICWKAIRPSKRGSGRETEMAACVNGCEVRWIED
ncbi:hypothetical protein [Neptuniibacter marinus]|jgi:hypothetical protein|uniref:hypothetical protein n=1 Tax=Neptuniibacter marinus TaxID=1806670 RepID=UPI003B5BDC76